MCGGFINVLLKNNETFRSALMNSDEVKYLRMMFFVCAYFSLKKKKNTQLAQRGKISNKNLETSVN